MYIGQEQTVDFFERRKNHEKNKTYKGTRRPECI